MVTSPGVCDDHEEPIMERGTIKKLVSDRGFGFIEPESGADVFFHHSVVEDGLFDALHISQSVEFEPDTSGNRGKGPRVEKVRPTTD